MTISEIEQNLTKIFESFNKESFIFDLLRAYGLPKSSITRLQSGSLNIANNIPNTVAWKKKVYFYHVTDNRDLHIIISEIVANNIKHDERFAIVTDFVNILAVDTRTKQTLDIPLCDLPKYAHFFLPWAGIEKSALQNEAVADRKASEKMAKLFDEIKKDNSISTDEEIHAMNIFLTRLLFCYFAEDTGIFSDTQFTNALKDRTHENGSDVQDFFAMLFDILNTKPDERAKDLPENISPFPYVNGGLFSEIFPIPVFTRHSRKVLLESGTLDWSTINPDIFGSMFQGVVSEEQRSNLGQHYTSVPNIMKVLEPLFLNDLNIEFNKVKETLI